MKGTGNLIRKPAFVLLLIVCLILASCSAETITGVSPLLGDWAFDYEPETSVLLVREDGTAVFNGGEYTWEDDGQSLYLKNQTGETEPLRYTDQDDRVQIYLHSTYTRTAKDTDDAIYGAWIKDGSPKSSFVFEKDGRFMEDGVFVGRFEVDREAGTFTLIYEPSYFADTTCYFVQNVDSMSLEYPWTIVGKQ